MIQKWFSVEFIYNNSEMIHNEMIEIQIKILHKISEVFHYPQVFK